LPHHQTSKLLSNTNRAPSNPGNFPVILTPSLIFKKKIDSMREIIPDGALKKERA